MGRPIAWRRDIKQLLLAQGFVDVRTEVIKLPITIRPASCSREVQALSEYYTKGLIMSLEALSMRPYTQAIGWTPGAVRIFVESLVRFLQEAMDVNLYNNLSVFPTHTYVSFNFPLTLYNDGIKNN